MKRREGSISDGPIPTNELHFRSITASDLRFNRREHHHVFTVIYRWRVKPDRQAEFRLVWHRRTERIRRERGSYGSRLHQEPYGAYCAIALWPSRRLWEATEPPLTDDAEDAATFRATILEALPTLTMEAVDDLWDPP